MNVARFDCSVSDAYIDVLVGPQSAYKIVVGVYLPSQTVFDEIVALGPGQSVATLIDLDVDADSDGIYGYPNGSGSPGWQSYFAYPSVAGAPLVPLVRVDLEVTLSYTGSNEWDVDWSKDSTFLFTDTNVTFSIDDTMQLKLGVGGRFAANVADEVYLIDTVTVYANDFTTVIFFDDFSDGDFSLWTDVVGDATVVPFTPPAPPASGAQSPLWRFVIGDLETFEVLSILDNLASNRNVTLTLDQPAVASMVVPADNPEINLPWPDAGDDPFLAEGTRVLWGLRREQTTDPWIIRFAGLILQLEDNAESDNAYTTLTAWDPWEYLFSRPVCQDDGTLPGPNGLSFGATRTDVIAATLLRNTIDNQGPVGIDAGVTYSGTTFYDGTLDGSEMIDINFAQGTTVGQAWQALCDASYCDIWIEPIYDPNNRPGYLGQLNVFNQQGAERDDAIFAWDEPSRSLVGLHRLIEGNQRANAVKFFAGQGGSAAGGQVITLQEDAASIAKYGQYWRQTFFPNQTVAAAVQALAFAQLQLSKNGRITVTFSPAPQRSPLPFTEYFLGDRVPVYASSRFRAPIPDSDIASSNLNNYQRIYGIPITIGDDATEQIQSMLTAIPTSSGG